MADEKRFFFCPYSPGILVTHPDDIIALKPAKVFNRRSGKDRRRNPARSMDRRTINVPVCPEYGSPECSYNRYPAFRSHPDQLLALCHSKSIARFLETYTSENTPE